MSTPQFRHGECFFYADGVCTLTGARVRAEDPGCPLFTPKAFQPYGYPPILWYGWYGFPGYWWPSPWPWFTWPAWMWPWWFW